MLAPSPARELTHKGTAEAQFGSGQHCEKTPCYPACFSLFFRLEYGAPLRRYLSLFSETQIRRRNTMSTPSLGPTPEFAVAYCHMMLDGLSQELETTKRVIAAVPDSKSDYRPDPHARTAQELAWHLANTDIQFLDGIADLKFNMETPEGD